MMFCTINYGAHTTIKSCKLMFWSAGSNNSKVYAQLFQFASNFQGTVIFWTFHPGTGNFPHICFQIPWLEVEYLMEGCFSFKTWLQLISKYLHKKSSQWYLPLPPCFPGRICPSIGVLLGWMPFCLIFICVLLADFP